MPPKDLDLDALVGEENFLINPDDWTEAIAVRLAAQQDIVLGEDHWRIIWFIREWYVEHELAPSARDAAHHVALSVIHTLAAVWTRLFAKAIAVAFGEVYKGTIAAGVANALLFAVNALGAFRALVFV